MTRKGKIALLPREIRDERVLHSLCQDIVELRRGDHSRAWLQMEQDRLGREQEKTDAEVIEHFERWLKNTGVRDLVCQNWTSPEARRRHMHEIFGLEPGPLKTLEIRNTFGVPVRSARRTRSGKARHPVRTHRVKAGKGR
jgi:hypothetical protein